MYLTALTNHRKIQQSLLLSKNLILTKRKLATSNRAMGDLQEATMVAISTMFYIVDRPHRIMNLT